MQQVLLSTILLSKWSKDLRFIAWSPDRGYSLKGSERGWCIKGKFYNLAKARDWSGWYILKFHSQDARWFQQTYWTHIYTSGFFFFFFPFQFLAWTESSKIDLPCPNADTWQSQCNFYQKLTVSSSASRNTNSHTLSMPFMLQPASKFPGQINSILGAFVERGKVTVSFWCFFFFFECSLYTRHC